MLINRNNYESFFLLYVDGELCATNMKLVEDFAAANEDLGKELDMLKAVVLPADDIIFEDKGELFKPVPIDSILHEKLLLKIDNELSDDEAGSLNKLIDVDKNVKEEFNLLQGTKLDPAEKIIFAEKHLLYKKEKDNLVIGRFVRWAAAAVLLGFGFYFGANMLNKKSDLSTESIARTNLVPAKKANDTNTAAGIADSQNTASTATPEDATETNAKQASASAPVTANKTEEKNNKIFPENKTSEPTNNTEEQRNIAAVNTAATQKENNNAVQQKIAGSSTPALAQVSPKEINVPAAVDNNIVPLETSYAQAIAYNDNDDSNNKILYMDEDDVKRSKAGGIFRKVKRFVERTAKVKTGNTLRIAGFAIASK